VMGEIKIALKKEMKTDGEQLIVEILQCRHITYKFKSPDHLPDLYVKIYVMNISTQEKVDQEKNKSIGGKFMKETLIGEACICLDKVDLEKE
ncbi:hypothetical protein EI555_010056, partial [Monodon monoceros]